MQLISQRLRRRTSTAGADPLVTYYDLSTGERTELSAVTVSNWVDKTCHLLTDEYGLDIGDVVVLDVARTHPGHWVTACLELACWRLGVTVAVDQAGDARLVVTGPLYAIAAEQASARGADLLACSLHPLGLPFAERLPSGVADYSLEVRGQPDQYAATPVPPGQTAWRSAEETLSQAEIDAVTGSTRRRLLRPSTPWPTVRDGVLAALVGGGSVVVAVGDDDAALRRIRVTENVEDELEKPQV
ncbi:MAG TPA: TIGR03089 family protein [Microlunatus sp.]|nr:TIGR03089 family protein [Microlunatus sp.]